MAALTCIYGKRSNSLLVVHLEEVKETYIFRRVFSVNLAISTGLIIDP